MAASKSYYARTNYQYFSGERDSPIGTYSMFELDESDIWNVASSLELQKTMPSSRISKKSSAVVKREEIGGKASSLPVNVPDWSKILKEDYRENRRRDNNADDDFNEYNYDEDDTGHRISPHEFLVRQLARTGIASFSVHEGIGRTMKGRDLSRVRNAIWKKTCYKQKALPSFASIVIHTTTSIWESGGGVGYKINNDWWMGGVSQ